MFNQFVVRAEEPLLFHTGLDATVPPQVRGRRPHVVPLADLRWIAFGHVEADECGAMKSVHRRRSQREALPTARPHPSFRSNRPRRDRAPCPLADDEVLDLGGFQVRNIDTPHIPHGWDAHVLVGEATRTLFCGDLFPAFGENTATTTDDIVQACARMPRRSGKPTALTPTTAPTIRRLADLDIDALALMHGPTYRGDCTKALLELADGPTPHMYTNAPA